MSRIERVFARRFARSRTSRGTSLRGTWTAVPTCDSLGKRRRGPRWRLVLTDLANRPVAGWWALTAACAQDIAAAKVKARREARGKAAA